VIALGLDGPLLLRSLHESLTAVGRDRKIRASFRVEGSASPPLDRPPESMRPDRPEVMTPVGSGESGDLEPGVRFECQVGRHNKARGLTTGFVTLDPGAGLTYHTHPFSEAITLLEGRVSVVVGGREYGLEPMDNVVIPPGLAHLARNLSDVETAVLHVALASDSPTSSPADETLPRRRMSRSETGPGGGERVNRFRTAARSEAGPNTSFIDFFNERLLPGVGMSGGYGLFYPGGRLPAHVHDFDESICIIKGEATCIVEGRRYNMREGSTALQPRGRVHYFINTSDAPMAMIWVYAGAMPERIMVDERCATEAGDPWRGGASDE
jgi:quercetin dioxygenase-like cupin family protein